MAELTDKQRAAFDEANARADITNDLSYAKSMFLSGIAQGRKDARADFVKLLRELTDKERDNYDQPHQPYHTFRAGAFEIAADLIEDSK